MDLVLMTSILSSRLERCSSVGHMRGRRTCWPLTIVLVQLRLVEDMILHTDLARLATAWMLDGVHLASLGWVHHCIWWHLIVGLWPVEVLRRGLTSGGECLVPGASWRLLVLTRLGIGGWLARVAGVRLRCVGECVGHDQ